MSSVGSITVELTELIYSALLTYISAQMKRAKEECTSTLQACGMKSIKRCKMMRVREKSIISNDSRN